MMFNGITHKSLKATLNSQQDSLLWEKSHQQMTLQLLISQEAFIIIKT